MMDVPDDAGSPQLSVQGGVRFMHSTLTMLNVKEQLAVTVE